MEQFTIKFLDPFMEKEAIKNTLASEEVLDVFNNIAWYEIIMKAFNLAISDNTTNVNEFWYFSIDYRSKGNVYSLLIVPNFASASTFSENEVKFSTEFFRPNKVKTSKFSQFFFGAKEKLNKDYSTYGKELSLGEVSKIVHNFINSEHEILQQKLMTQGPLMHYSLLNQ